MHSMLYVSIQRYEASIFLPVKDLGRPGIQHGYNQTIPNCNISGKFSNYLRLDYIFPRIDNADKHVVTTHSTHCCLVRPYGNIYLAQYCFSQWLDGWWHQDIAWNNPDISSMRFCCNFSACPNIMTLNSIDIKSISHIPGVNELKLWVILHVWHHSYGNPGNSIWLTDIHDFA